MLFLPDRIQDSLLEPSPQMLIFDDDPGQVVQGAVDGNEAGLPLGLSPP